MTLNIKDGLIQINETSEDKITNFHLNRGFAMLSAFRSEYTLEQNRASNRQLASRLKALGYGFIKVTGCFIEFAELDGNRKQSITEEALLVPIYNIKTKESFDFSMFKSDMTDLSKEFNQDYTLVSPPADQDSITIASAANTFFLMREKTLKGACANIKLESIWLDEPAHTVSGVRIRSERNELPPFGSHYHGNSQIYGLATLN